MLVKYDPCLFVGKYYSYMSMKGTFIWLYVKKYECQSVMRDSFCLNVCI